MDVLTESTIVDFSAWIFLFGKVVGGIFFIATLLILKNFLAKGFSWAIAEFMLGFADDELKIRMCKYMANGDIVLDKLNEIDKLNKKVENRIKSNE